MARTIAYAVGYDRSRAKQVSRLGHEASQGQANTWRTFTTCYVAADGRGYVQVERPKGVVVHRWDFDPEE